jgi:hypothetical protein
MFALHSAASSITHLELSDYTLLFAASDLYKLLAIDFSPSISPQPHPMTNSRSLRATALLALLGSVSAHGAAYVGSAYEGFDYTASSQINNTLNGGTGWNATGDGSQANTQAWGVLASGTIRNVHTTGLDYGASGYPAETGLAATVAGTGTAGANVGRNFGQTVDSNTFYFSYLTQKTVDTVRTLNLAFFSGTNERLAIGQIANNINLRNPNGTADVTTTPNQGHFAALVSNSQNNAAFNGVYTSATPESYALGSTFFIVGKIEFNYAAGVEDKLTLYINPSSLTDEGALTPYLEIGVNDFGSISAFRIFAGGNQTSPSTFNASGGVFDEIRLGTNFTAVTGAIPEPSSFAALAGLAGLAVAASRRRRA